MSIFLEPVGLLIRYCSGRLNAENRIELSDSEVGQSLETVCQNAGLPLEMISLFVVNGQTKTRTYHLQKSDLVKCVAIIGGG
jgi:hypothetical protein